MAAKKGSKYVNSKSSSILSKYTPQQIQELLNSGQCKQDIIEKLGIYRQAFNVYIKKHNLTYKQPCMIKYGKQYKSKRKKQELVAPPPNPKADEEALERFRKQFAERKQQRMLKELNNGVYD